MQMKRIPILRSSQNTELILGIWIIMGFTSKEKLKRGKVGKGM